MRKNPSRYRDTGIEGEWHPGSRKRVLRNLLNLENELLIKHTPCRPGDLTSVSGKVAEIHAEFLLIHPFREGNGRMARWLADLMFLQAGFPMPLYNFSGKGSMQRKKAYLDAVLAGYGQNYAPLTDFFRCCVEARLRELEE